VSSAEICGGSRPASFQVHPTRGASVAACCVHVCRTTLHECESFIELAEDFEQGPSRANPAVRILFVAAAAVQAVLQLAYQRCDGRTTAISVWMSKVRVHGWCWILDRRPPQVQRSKDGGAAALAVLGRRGAKNRGQRGGGQKGRRAGGK
jgi:hypothetical protein